MTPIVSELKSSFKMPKDFVYKKRASLENILKLFIALRLFDNLNGLLKQREIKSLEEIKNDKFFKILLFITTIIPRNLLFHQILVVQITQPKKVL